MCMYMCMRIFLLCVFMLVSGKCIYRVKLINTVKADYKIVASTEREVTLF